MDDIVIPTHCPVLGIKLCQRRETGSDSFATVDKIIPYKGYIKGNIQVISYRANRIKSDATLEELRKVVDYVEKATQSCGP